MVRSSVTPLVGFTRTKAVADAVQPVASVAVTTKLVFDVGDMVTDWVVCPPFHKNVLPVVAVSVVLFPEQTDRIPVMAVAMPGLTVILKVVGVPEQVPAMGVTVIVAV